MQREWQARSYDSDAVSEKPLHRWLHWTKFPDQYAKSKIEHRSSFRALAKRIQQTRRKSKEDLPWMKLATFGEQRTAKDSLRSNENMIAINGIELDYDDGDLTWDQAWARLYEARLPALLYTTRRHTVDKPRFRVLLPTSRPLPPAERSRLVARAYGVLRGSIDGASFTPSQSFYFGSVGDGRITVELVDPPGGRYIDDADDLDYGALDKNGNPWRASDTAMDYDDDGESSGLAPEPDVERIKRDLSYIPSDEREIWLRVGQALHNEFGGDEDGYDLWDSWSQNSSKYDEDDQRRVWDSLGSFSGKPVGIGTIHHLAKAHKPTTIGGLTFETPNQCSTAPLRGYVWKHMLAPGDIASIYGPPGAGKSTIAPHIAYMIALGETAFGLRTKPGLVFYVAAEDTTGLRQRVHALMLRHGDAPNFCVVGNVSDLFSEDSADLEHLAEAVEEQRPALIIIDTLAMAFPGLEENDSKSMSRVVSVSRQLAQAGAAVVLIHHDTKAEGSTPRGHSVLNGALDMAMHLRRDEDGIIRGKLTKNRNGSPHRDIAFRIGTEVLGLDVDGETITAPLVEELTGPQAANPVRLSAAQREALAILTDLEADGRVGEEAWRDACIDGRRVSQSDDRDSRKRAFNRIRASLFQKRLISFRNGQVSIAEVTSDDDAES